MILLKKSDHKIDNNLYYLGIDLGSSSIKIAVVKSETGEAIGWIQQPREEMAIVAPQPGWAEQDPQDWWHWVCLGIQTIKQKFSISEQEIVGLGISYQMHGLVLVDQKGLPLRDAIIWCDSRAVAIGNKAYDTLGKEFCNTHLLNSPGNFTASKLRWVRDNEPDIYQKAYTFLLPGDYIAYRLSGVLNTTISGLSEGIFWDFKADSLSKELVHHFQFDSALVPERVETFSEQARVSALGAKESGLREGTPILYRAGDQPNNAVSLNVMRPGEIAATGGTSGVIYAITDNLSVKECDRVNNFAHVNYKTGEQKWVGKLLCINGAGIQYSWLRENLGIRSYEDMNLLASKTPIGSDGLGILPFGNGAERILGNKNIGSHILHLDLNRHSKAHLCRAALEGIAFAFAYGFEIMQSDKITAAVIRAGNDNLFRSEIFSNTIASLLGKAIDIYNTTGAIGAARACALTVQNLEDLSTFAKYDYVKTYTPASDTTAYQKAYQNWKRELEHIINQ